MFAIAETADRWIWLARPKSRENGVPLVTASISTAIARAFCHALESSNRFTPSPLTRWSAQHEALSTPALNPVSPPYGRSFDMMIVPLAPNIPPTPCATLIFAPATCAGAVPRICRTLSCSAYMPYIPECV